MTKGYLTWTEYERAVFPQPAVPVARPVLLPPVNVRTACAVFVALGIIGWVTLMIGVFIENPWCAAIGAIVELGAFFRMQTETELYSMDESGANA